MAATASSITMDHERLKEVKEFDESKMGVKGLSDSGITTIPSIFIHPPETRFHLKSSSTCTGIPVIDLSCINSDVQGQISSNKSEKPPKPVDSFR